MIITLDAAAGEWIKLRSVRSTWWATGGVVVLMALAGLAVGSDSRGGTDPVGRLVTGSMTDSMLNFGEWAVLIPAILAVTAEYASRSISVSLQCVPVRPRLLLGKAAIVGAFGFGLGIVGALAGGVTTLAALGRLDGWGPGDAIRTLVVIGVYCALISMIALGTGTLTRSTAATAALMFLLIMVLPTVLGQVGQLLRWHAMVEASAYFPGVAGRIMITGEPGAYGVGASVAVLLVWTAVALAAATVVFHRRDA